MNNYVKGIATGAILTFTLQFAVVKNNNPVVVVVEPGPLQKGNIIQYAGLLSPLHAANFALSGTGNSNEPVIQTEPLTDQEACTRVARYENTVGGKYGVFLTKTLIENLFEGNSHNGLWVFLGKGPVQDGNSETNFIIKSSTENYTTAPIEGTGYRMIEAVCPSYCDGMDLTKCK